MEFKFNHKKAIQAIALLLKQKHPINSENYMRLLKLLYIADRESIKESGEPITSDKYIAMKRGPVLSRMLDLIKQQDYLSPEWDKWIQRNGYEVQLINDPGNSQLCRYEINKLIEVWDRFEDKDEWEMVEITHTFPEWIKNNPGDSSKPIPLEDLLEAVDRKEWLDEVRKTAKETAAARKLFGIC